MSFKNWMGFFFLLFAFSCGPSERDSQTTVRLTYSKTTDAKPFPAQSISSISCFVLNVVGDGIESADTRYSPSDLLPALRGGSACTYPGKSSQFFSLSSGETKDLSISIPTGTQRIVQILGYATATSTCPTDKTLGELFNTAPDPTTTFKDIYEFGRKVVNLNAPQTIDLSLSATGERANCAPTAESTVPAIASSHYQTGCITDGTLIAFSMGDQGAMPSGLNISSQKVDFDFSGGTAGTITVNHYNDTTCTSLGIIVVHNIQNFILASTPTPPPTPTSGGSSTAYQISFTLGTSTIRAVGSVPTPLNTYCTSIPLGSPNQDIDVTGICGIPGLNSIRLDLVQKTTSGIIFQGSIPGFGTSTPALNPSAMLTTKVYPLK